MLLGKTIFCNIFPFYAYDIKKCSPFIFVCRVSNRRMNVGGLIILELSFSFKGKIKTIYSFNQQGNSALSGFKMTYFIVNNFGSGLDNKYRTLKEHAQRFQYIYICIYIYREKVCVCVCVRERERERERGRGTEKERAIDRWIR